MFSNDIKAQTLWAKTKSSRNDSLYKKYRFNNSIRLSLGSFHISGMQHDGGAITQIGAYYERRCYKQIHLGIGYMQWVPIFMRNQDQYVVYPKSVFTDTTVTIGELQTLNTYKMIDLYASYKLNIYNTSHAVSLGFGASYIWGSNSYLESYYVYLFEIHSTSIDKKVDYYATLLNCGYDYTLLNNRLTIGANIRGRFYHQASLTEYDYNLHVGVNF